jgi:hypothetical protein
MSRAYFMSASRLIFHAFLVAILSLPAGGLLLADEWNPQHELVSHTGVMNMTEPPPLSEVFFSGPVFPGAPGWFEGLKAWRQSRTTLLRYDDAQYDRADLQWTQRVFSQVQLLIWDRRFYDAQKGEYTVDRFLADTENSIGPIDAVLIWHLYPNLGADDRNQFDLLRDLPGGIPGLRKMVEQFHRRGVKVFFPYLAWDTGTRDEGAASSAVICSRRSAPTGSISIRWRPYHRSFAKPQTPPAIRLRWNLNSSRATSRWPGATSVGTIG